MVRGFFDFIRKQGVVGLIIGFMLGGSLNKLTGALVGDIINPLFGLVFNTANLRDKAWKIGDASILWGDLISVTIDFIVIAAVVYFGFKMLKLDKIDLPKE